MQNLLPAYQRLAVLESHSIARIIATNGCLLFVILYMRIYAEIANTIVGMNVMLRMGSEPEPEPEP